MEPRISDELPVNKNAELTVDDELELNLETLDQWETELDQFAAEIMQRLSSVTGEVVDTTGLIPPSRTQSSEDSDFNESSDEAKASQLLQTLQDMSP